MRNGGSNWKGSQFERNVAKQLSRWISNGAKEDLFWRSGGSGARATRARTKAIMLPNQAGDISTNSIEGALLTECLFIECKHVAQLRLCQFILGRPSAIGRFWAEVEVQARAYERVPSLIAKQNLGPILMVLPWSVASNWTCCRQALLARVLHADVAIVGFSELLSQCFSPPLALQTTVAAEQTIDR